jgi:hypothetical protein
VKMGLSIESGWGMLVFRRGAVGVGEGARNRCRNCSIGYHLGSHSSFLCSSFCVVLIMLRHEPNIKYVPCDSFG